MVIIMVIFAKILRNVNFLLNNFVIFSSNSLDNFAM